jgi:2-hydroxyglutarate dehydrogenase/L-2-hydroxyglutarate oxidase
MEGSEAYDVVVVGAGILGLATARRLLQERPGLRLVLLEKEAEIATHQTGHNSGVVHSGIYYAPGSLKARLCTQGKAALERYVAERGLPYERCGKLIVALDESELPRLAELERRAIANGVGGLRVLEGDELRTVEPNAAGIRALHARETAIVDYRAVAAAFAADVQEAGGELQVGATVVGISERGGTVAVETTAGSVTAAALVGCAGLQSDRIATLAGTQPTVRIVPFRGDYYTLRPQAGALVNGLLYPVPDPAYPFLGVHFTKLVDGRVVAGPNAVLALARERYNRAGVDVRDVASTLGYRGFWRLARHHYRFGAGEVWRDVVKRAYVRELQRYVPAVTADDLEFGPSGIRAQALDREGRLVDDFVLERTGRQLHVLNAPSPAATASLAIADHLAGQAAETALGI